MVAPKLSGREGGEGHVPAMPDCTLAFIRQQSPAAAKRSMGTPCEEEELLRSEIAEAVKIER